MVDRITVTERTHETITVDTDETLANTVIDVTNTGASATIRTRGTGWTIENVGFDGYNDTGNPALAVADIGGRKSWLNHIYLGDGGGQTGVYVTKHNTGEVRVSDVHAADWGGYGFHSAAPVSIRDDESGWVVYDRCYAAENGRVQFLTGTDRLDGCVTTGNTRAVWARANTYIRDCELGVDGQYAVHAGIGRPVDVTVENTAYSDGFKGGVQTARNAEVIEQGVSHDPTTEIPTSVPTGPEDAATGAAETQLVADTMQDAGWRTSSHETLDQIRSFSEAVGGLSSGTEYEFRAVADGDETQEGETQTFATRLSGSSDQPIEYTISDVYLADIDGPAIHVATEASNASVVIENANIDGATVGVLADGVSVEVRDSEIVADEPFGTQNGGSIDDQSTNTGADADPTVPESVPTSPQEAVE